MSWPWHWASMAAGSFKDTSAAGQRELKLSKRKSLASRLCMTVEIAALSGRCQLGMEISCGGHGGTSQGFLETIHWQFPESRAVFAVS